MDHIEYKILCVEIYIITIIMFFLSDYYYYVKHTKRKSILCESNNIQF